MSVSGLIVSLAAVVMLALEIGNVLPIAGWAAGVIGVFCDDLIDIRNRSNHK